jgi:glycine/D-amino acid oxidase-like deaminating enzyme
LQSRAINLGQVRRSVEPQALSRILQHTYSGYAPLLVDCPQADQHLRHNGCLYAYGTEQGIAGAQAAMELRRSLGIAQQVLNASDVEQLEPALAGATGQLVADCIAGKAPAWLDSFSVQRF